MDLSTTLSLVQTILAAIQSLGQLQSVCSISNCKSELDDLQNTVETVRAVLMDADAKQDSLNFQEKNYIQELKDAVYDADDVLDEFLTLAKRKQLRNDDDSFPDKVKSFFSRFKHLTHKLSSKVKTVNDKLNKIATKSDKFSFKVDYKPMKFTKDETSSFMCDKIIGREEDVEKIIDVLLSSDNVDHPDVSFLVIMGMGGLGKTALAQLVYNDPRISETFELKRWSCIADHDHWSLNGFLGKVVKGSSIDDKTSLEEIHAEVKMQLGGKIYLLVLDDVWTESYEVWQRFEGYLKVGGRGSCIIVTTRSKIAAQMIGGNQVHELRGLSELDSWHLFERMAFQTEERDEESVKLGKEIAKKCIGVPLAIRVVGSLLRGEHMSKWLSFHDKGLHHLSESNDTMTRILKLSYDQLNHSLKACFAYCAIFPKDWQINKQMLIRLWMAQSYINLEYIGEEYFLLLLQRCFFQDISKNKFGEIWSFKIHDLLHDIAEKVAGEEICRFNYDTSNVGKRVRHVSFLSGPYTQILDSTRIRTCLQIKVHFDGCKLEQYLASKSKPEWICLRSLDLSNTWAKNLPISIGQLLHLRNLDLSSSMYLEVLPKSITKLVNLQTLDLHSCSRLMQLPDNASKLVDLSTLNVAKCDALSCMPAGIGVSTCLQTLCHFVVGTRGSLTSKQCFNGLEDLQRLNKLKGSLKIVIGVLKNAKFVKEEHGGGAYLWSKEHLQTIVIDFRRGVEYGSKESEQELLEEMQPHHGVKTLEVRGYHGETIPRWPRRGDNSVFFDLPNLVTLKICYCSELLYLPWQIGKVPYLKTLDIFDSLNLEYVMDGDSEAPVSGEGSSFFPRLDEVVFFVLPKLKGWWRSSESGSDVVNPNGGGSSREALVEMVSSPCFPLLEKPSDVKDSGKHLEWVSSPCFPVLKKLTIKFCDRMNSVPLCPQLKQLEIADDTRNLFWKDMSSTTHHQLLSSLSFPETKSKQLIISNLEWLESMPVMYTQMVSYISMSGSRCQSLGEVEDLFPTLMSSLRNLRISSCSKLKSVGGWLEHLSALEDLTIEFCPKVELGGMSWHNLAATLQTLVLIEFEDLEELPEGMQSCTSLQSLTICDWPKLKCLPKWMPKLTSIRDLFLRRCSDSLIERCKQPYGEDWPLIQHIIKTQIC